MPGLQREPRLRVGIGTAVTAAEPCQEHAAFCRAAVHARAHGSVHAGTQAGRRWWEGRVLDLIYFFKSEQEWKQGRSNHPAL